MTSPRHIFLPENIDKFVQKLSELVLIHAKLPNIEQLWFHKLCLIITWQKRKLRSATPRRKQRSATLRRKLRSETRLTSTRILGQKFSKTKVKGKICCLKINLPISIFTGHRITSIPSTILEKNSLEKAHKHLSNLRLSDQDFFNITIEAEVHFNSNKIPGFYSKWDLMNAIPTILFKNIIKNRPFAGLDYRSKKFDSIRRYPIKCRKLLCNLITLQWMSCQMTPEWGTGM